jgi:hypothetical protein
MKKFKLLFGAIALAAVTLVSCSKDDNNNSNDNAIIGKWTLEKEEALDVNNKVVSEYIPFDDELCDRSFTEFQKGGNMVSTYYEYYNNQCNAVTNVFSWTLTNNILVAVGEYGTSELTSKFEGNLMYLETPLPREEAQYYDLNVVKLRYTYKKL